MGTIENNEHAGDAADPMRAPTDGTADPAGDAAVAAQNEGGTAQAVGEGADPEPKDETRFLTKTDQATIAAEAVQSLERAAGEHSATGGFADMAIGEKAALQDRVSALRWKGWPSASDSADAPTQQAKDRVFAAVVHALDPFVDHDDDASTDR